MKITLHLNGKSCDFFAAVTARKGREAYALKKKIISTLKENGGEYPDELMDEMTGFVIRAFDNQFTAQQYLDGYEGWFFDAQKIIDAIMNDVAEALAMGFPVKNITPQPETEA
jgi:N-acetyl-anhydromuramyl-L-alanine amidase AmpD